MRIPSSIKSSSDLIGKECTICFDSVGYEDDANEIVAVIETMETDGLLVRYHTENDDCKQSCDKDEEGAVKTYTYIPWKSVRYIDFREDERYPEC